MSVMAVDVKGDKGAASEAEPSIRREFAEKSAIGETPIDHLWRDDVSTCDTRWRKRADRYDIQGVSESSGDTCYSFVAHMQHDVCWMFPTIDEIANRLVGGYFGKP